MIPLTRTSTFIRMGLAASALGIGISWPIDAYAESDAFPPHRLEFKASPLLPRCNDFNSFYAILAQFVQTHSIDPTAKRKLIVNITLLPDGKKREHLSLLDPDGVEVQSATHDHPPSDECFRILYWTAIDSMQLMKATIPVPEEELPMSVEKLVEESEKPDVVQEKKQDKHSNPTPSSTGPIYDAEFYSEPKPEPQQCKVQDEPRLPWHVMIGVGATIGLTRIVMPGFRVGVGRTVGPVLFELDAQVSPPLITAAWDTGVGQPDSVRGQAYVGSFAACAHKKPLMGCGIATGGVAGYSYDKPVFDGERSNTSKMGGVFGLGMRVGAEISLSTRWALRLEAQGYFPLAMSDFLLTPGRFVMERDYASPVWSGFVSVVPSF